MRKVYFVGTHRTRHPQETLESIRPLLPRYGITRLADVTGLDDLGVPVVMAVRPLGLSLSVSQGKGATLEAALVSGAMEAVELWHAEHAVPAPVETGPAAGLGLPYDIAELEQHKGSLLCPGTVLDWIAATCLVSGEQTLLPREAVVMGRQLRDEWRTFTIRASSNGVASGNTVDEAIVHALYEVAERDALDALDQPGAIREVVDPASVTDDHNAQMIDAITQAGAWLEICHVPGRFGFCTMLAYLWREDQGASVVSGAGCHSSPQIALSRALAEAAQTRMTFIAGTRDDILPRMYQPGSCRPPKPAPPDTGFPQVAAAYRRRFGDVADEAAWAAEQVTRVTGAEPMMVELTCGQHARPEFSVVKISAPGLGFSGRLHVSRPGEEVWV
jgi:ribosomal protein S12 methylthiotransferase accessory factor